MFTWFLKTEKLNSKIKLSNNSFFVILIFAILKFRNIGRSTFYRSKFWLPPKSFWKLSMGVFGFAVHESEVTISKFKMAVKYIIFWWNFDNFSLIRFWTVTPGFLRSLITNHKIENGRSTMSVKYMIFTGQRIYARHIRSAILKSKFTTVFSDL